MLKKSAGGVHRRAVPYSARREPQRLSVPKRTPRLFARLRPFSFLSIMIYSCVDILM